MVISAALSTPWSGRSTSLLPVVLCFILFCFAFYELVIKKAINKKSVPLPPGPRGLPIVGNLPFLDPNLHTYFTSLAKTYGPIFKLQLGSRLCIVLNTPPLVKQIHKEHDIIFSNRDVPACAAASSYGGIDILWSPYGANWRMLRKISVMELFSNKRMEGLYGLRRTEVREMVKQIYSKPGQPIVITNYILEITLSMIARMMWGATLEKQDWDHVLQEFGKVASAISTIGGQSNISDMFPILERFDLQGMRRKITDLSLWLDRTLDYVINKRVSMRSQEEENENSTEHTDFLQILLELKDQGHEKTTLTITHVKALLVDMLVAGTDTTAATIEWVLAELMKHPEILQKVVEEIEQVVGTNNIVEESHLPKLQYLDAVVKETMRLHTVAPLLIPKLPSESCVVGGYLIPKGTKVFVNAWAIHRDPENWENPSEFKPERFLNEGTDNEANYKYMPFGFGRRICVGMPLVDRVIPYMLASLLHSFTWKLPEDTVLELSETFGLKLAKTVPLVVIPTPRLSEPELYT